MATPTFQKSMTPFSLTSIPHPTVMYLLALTVAMCLSYAVLYALFPYFFTQKFRSFTAKSYFSVFCIFVISLFAYFVSFSIQDAELANRVMHAFGGGFLAFFVCFRVVKDSELSLPKFQFFLFSFFLVTSLGVANEMMEFYLQHQLNYFAFSETNTDTWLDLLSNSVGILIASLLFVPLIAKPKAKKTFLRWIS